MKTTKFDILQRKALPTKIFWARPPVNPNLFDLSRFFLKLPKSCSDQKDTEAMARPQRSRKKVVKRLLTLRAVRPSLEGLGLRTAFMGSSSLSQYL